MLDLKTEFENHCLLRRAKFFDDIDDSDAPKFEIVVGRGEKFLGGSHTYYFPSELSAQTAVNLAKSLLSDVDDFLGEYELELFGVFTDEQARAQRLKKKLVAALRDKRDEFDFADSDDEDPEETIDRLRDAIRAADVAREELIAAIAVASKKK